MSGTFNECYFRNLLDINEVRIIMGRYSHEDGHFLVRNSFSKPGMFTVSVMHNRSIKHINIFQRNSFYYFQDKEFSCIDMLLDYYKQVDVPNIEGIRHVRLRYPISQSQSPLPRYEPKKKRISIKDRLFNKKSECQPDQRPLVSSRSLDLENKPDDQLSQRRFSEQPTTIPQPSPPSLRPQPPLPREAYIQPAYNGDDYSIVMDEVDHVPDLLRQLHAEEGSTSTRCDCGLYFDEAELPRDWTLHISRDAGTYGRVFFMGPQQQTAWNLPLEVVCDLSIEQQDRIKRLLESYQQGNMQKLSSGASSSEADSAAEGAAGGAASTQRNPRSRGRSGQTEAERDRMVRMMEYSPGNEAPEGYNSQSSVGSLSSFNPQETVLDGRRVPMIPNSYLSQRNRLQSEASVSEEVFL